MADQTDTFQYTISDGTSTATGTVTVLISDSATPPASANNDSATTNQGSAVDIPVLSNDTPAGVVIQSVTDPPNGATSIVANQIRYTPDSGFVGSDSFSYTISEPTGGSTATATVAVQVNLVATNWWQLPIRSGRAWSGGVAYWYDRDAPYNIKTAAAEWASEAADVALIDAGTGSSHTDTTTGIGQSNLATWNQVIGGAEGSTMNTSLTQFDWTSATGRYGFQEVVAQLPVDLVRYPHGSGWLIWSCVLIPNTSTTAAGNSGIWTEITNGNHDSKYQKFGERVVRRMALTGHPLKRLIIDLHKESNRANTFQVYNTTRTAYQAAMERAIEQIRAGANAYQAGAGSQFKFMHRPSGRAGNIGTLASYCPRNIDVVGLSWHPDDRCTSAAAVTTMLDGTMADTYGYTTELVALADSLNVPMCFPEHAPSYNPNGSCPIADVATQMFYDHLATIADRVVADCVFHQNVRYPLAYEATDAAGIAAWKRMVDLRKNLWSGIKG